jgi:hypothetical protein
MRQFLPSPADFAGHILPPCTIDPGKKWLPGKSCMAAIVTVCGTTHG